MQFGPQTGMPASFATRARRRASGSSRSPGRTPEAQARLLELGTYGPVLGDAAAKGTPEQRKVLVTAPENIKNMLILNEQQAALYSAKYTNDWDRMQLE